MSQIVVGRIGKSWGVFEMRGHITVRCLTPTLYATEIEALRAFAAMQEVK